MRTDYTYCFRHHYNLPCPECSLEKSKHIVINHACPPNCRRDIELALLQKLKGLGYGKMESKAKVISQTDYMTQVECKDVFVPLDIEATMEELK
jgi:hypothetical protein